MNALLSYLGLIGLRYVGEHAPLYNATSTIAPYSPPESGISKVVAPTTETQLINQNDLNKVDESTSSNGAPALEGLVYQPLQTQTNLANSEGQGSSLLLDDGSNQEEETPGTEQTNQASDEEKPSEPNSSDSSQETQSLETANPEVESEPTPTVNESDNETTKDELAQPEESSTSSIEQSETIAENNSTQAVANQDTIATEPQEQSLVLQGQGFKNATGLGAQAALEDEVKLPQEQAPDNLNQTATQNTTDVEALLIEKSEFVSKILLLVILVVVVQAYTAFMILLIYNKLWIEIKSAILNGYQEFSERQVPSKKLYPSQIKSLEAFAWNEYDQDNPCLIEREKAYEGETFKFEYKAKESNLFYAANSPIDTGKTDNRVFYFEVEVVYLHDLSKIIIGFMDGSTTKEMLKAPPGKFNNSIGFNLKTGEIYQNNEVAHVFKYQEFMNELMEANQSGMLDLTGNFFGVGVNLYYDKFFFTFNGTVLNSLSYQAVTDIRYKTYDMRRKDLIAENEGIRNKEKLNVFTRKLQLQKEYRDELKKIKEFKCNFQNLIPVIFVEKFCRLSINVGGAPFQIRDRELKHGLLMGKEK